MNALDILYLAGPWLALWWITHFVVSAIDRRNSVWADGIIHTGVVFLVTALPMFGWGLYAISHVIDTSSAMALWLSIMLLLGSMALTPSAQSWVTGQMVP